MDADEREALERELRRSFEVGDLQGTATAAIRAYGPELFGFLVGLARDADVASELFSGACEKIWRGLPAFRWESSCRVWCYAIARHHFLHWARDRDRRNRAVALSDAPLSQLVQSIRSTTAIHLRTEVKDEFAKLRETLEADDQLLLQLRLEGAMAWNDIARVLAGEDAPAPSTREVAALRKRYERLKRELQELARKHQLLP